MKKCHKSFRKKKKINVNYIFKFIIFSETIFGFVHADSHNIVTMFILYTIVHTRCVEVRNSTLLVGDIHNINTHNIIRLYYTHIAYNIILYIEEKYC